MIVKHLIIIFAYVMKTVTNVRKSNQQNKVIKLNMCVEK